MPFQSYAFLLGFLPLVLAGTALLRRFAPGTVIWWLVAASLTFHASASPAGTVVLTVSLAANRAAVAALHRLPDGSARRATLTLAIAANLGLLGWYRHLPDWLAALDPALAAAPAIAPLGVSFFTFTQIGYLLDCHARLELRRPFGQHALFVTFFPSLTAGPILTAREIMPQITAIGRRPWPGEDVVRGLGIFTIGLLKKTLLADPLAPMVADGYADPAALRLGGAWLVAVGYALQLYFDFSGYSDMAVGVARMFGLRYPWNFAAPYRAASIIDYWQRWHISLTRFFMTTLHAPLAMAVLRQRRARGLAVDRAAQLRPSGFLAMHATPLALTMALAGIWHGAGLSFLVFGLLHGLFLTVNHAWRLWRAGWRWRPSRRLAALGRFAGITLTLLAVLVGSVFFRADTPRSACALLAAMAGLHGLEAGVPTPRGLAEAATIACLLLLVWFAPTTQRIMEPPDTAAWGWRPAAGWAAASGVALTVALLSAGGSAEFLYTRF